MHRNPSFELIREVPAGLNPKGKGVLGRRPSRSGSLCARWIPRTSTGCGSDQTTMLNWTSFRALERHYDAGEPITRNSHVEVARNGPSPSQDIHPNHLSILLLPAGQPLSLPRLN